MSLRLLFDRALQAICALLMVGLAVMVIVAVAMRTLGNSPLWYDEVASFWLVWLTFFSASLVTLRRAHLGFDGLVRSLPRKARLASFVIGEACCLAFFAVCAVYGARVVRIISGETLISLPWLGYDLIQSVIPVTAVLMLVAQAASSAEAWRSYERDGAAR